jgi:glycosyltransferase involved in cell wall biosynthesis
LAAEVTVRVSVLTAVGAGWEGWLPAAGDSVARARALSGADLEWVVCVDGGATVRGTERPDRVVGWSGVRGVSAARNAALAAATGDWVVPLDADDELDAGGLGQLLGVLAGCGPEVGWVGANRVLMDGARTPHWFDAARAFRAGELSPLWSSPFLFHPNSWLARRDVLLGSGGWPATGVNEDLAAVLLVSEDAGGRAEPAVLTRYRVWPGQEIGTGAYLEDKPAAFAVVEALLNARRRSAGRPPVSRPAAGPAYGRIRTGD